MDWIAHRGNSCGAAENTVQAVADSWRLGADAVEIDVRFSTDGIAYLFHDSQFENVELAQLTYLEIEDLVGESLAPKLTSILHPDSSGYYVLDLKQPQIADITILSRIVANSGVPATRIFIQSSDLDVLRAAGALMVDVRLSYLTSLERSGLARTIPKPADLLRVIDHIDIHSVALKGRRFLDSGYIDALKSSGLQVFVWTINRPERAKFYEGIGVDGIITDAIAEFRQQQELCAQDVPASKQSSAQ